MRIDHVALWTRDLDRLKRFYVGYFGAAAGPSYVNPAKGFESCFLSFSGGARLELMRTTTIPLSVLPPGTQGHGLTHLAIAVDSESVVDHLAEQLGTDGIVILDGPRRTGDGYYEVVLLDPDGNRIEICAQRPRSPAPSVSS
jgi:lactoylglutathione lyase